MRARLLAFWAFLVTLLYAAPLAVIALGCVVQLIHAALLKHGYQPPAHA